ncbi:unnamed protein product [Diamesa hyperborea]
MRDLLIVSCFWLIASGCVPKVHEFRYYETSGNYFGNLTGQLLDDALIKEITGQNKSSAGLKLTRMEICSITKNVFKSFSHAHTIDLSFNKITEIEDKSFEKNTKLENLKLQGNDLLKISKNLFFGEFNELTELDLSFNGISSIEESAFNNLVALMVIDISQNCLKQLPSELFRKNIQLTHVDLTYNEIKNIDTDLFSSKVEMEFIDLAHNQLDYAPNIAVKSIQSLILSHNQIKVLDLNFDSAQKKKSAQIEQIFLQSNQMEDIIELNEKRFDVRYLDLSNNSLTDFSTMPDLINLRFLSLHNNSLTELDLHNFKSKFPFLNHLDVKQNNINCQDYRYLSENFDDLLIIADTSIRVRCHNSSDSDDYESQIINEIRHNSQSVIEQLNIHQNHVIILLSGIIVILICFCIILIKQQYKKPTKKAANLLEQMEM